MDKNNASPGVAKYYGGLEKTDPDKDLKLEKIEEILEKIKLEEEKRKEARIVEEKRREKLIKEKKLKQEKMRRQEQEKRERLRVKTLLESRWEMARWITNYISENEETWRKEKLEREKNHQNWLMSWAKKSRFDKIREIREKSEEPKYQRKSPRQSCL